MKSITTALALVIFLVSNVTLSFAQTPLTIAKPFQGTVVEVPFTIVGTANPLSELQVTVNNESIGLFNVDADGNFRVPVSTVATTFQIEIVRLENGMRAESATLNLTSNGQAAPVVVAAPIKTPTKDPVIVKKAEQPIPNNGAYSDLPADGASMSRGGRILLEIGTGIGAGLLFGALAAAVAEGGSEELAWLAALSAITLSAASVWGVGELSGGDGSFWATLGGTILGIGAGSAVVLLLVVSAFNGGVDDSVAVAGIFVAASLPVAGAVLGYELSQSSTNVVNDSSPAIDETQPAKKRRLIWLLAPTIDGGTLQLGTTF